MAPVPETARQTWVLTGSPENFAATRDHDFGVIGLKERRRAFAEQICPGDRIVLYVTKVMAFGASMRVTGELFEDRTKLWPGKPGKADSYPWRFPTQPELVLEQAEWVPAEPLADELTPPHRWPRALGRSALQGKIRAVSEPDADALLEHMRAAAGVRA